MRKSLALASILALQVGVASAATITAGGAGTGNNLISTSSCTTVVDTGFTLKGCTSQYKDRVVLVEGDGTEVLEFDASGQARVAATDGSFNYARILFEEVDIGITQFVLNIDATIDGTVEFLIEFYGATADQTGSKSVNGTGNNFFEILAGSGEIIKAVTVSSTNTTLFQKVEQVRFGDTDGAPPGGPGPGNDVPAPASLALLGAGLAMLGFGRKRRA